MSYRGMTFASGLVTVALAAVGAAALQRLPAGTLLPIHWNAVGQPDRFANAATALFLPVLLALGLSALFAALPRLDPLQHRLARSAAVLNTTWAGLLGLMALVEIMIAGPAFGLHPSATWIVAATGALMIAIGNVLPKSRPGFFVGIRTPWAILDEDNWIATHRLAAWTFIAGGLMLVAAGLLPMPAAARQPLAIAAAAVAAVPPIVWSWWLWRRARIAGESART